MPLRADQLAQLQALGLDVTAKLPIPDLGRIGLVYVMDDASRRGLGVQVVQRWGRPNVATVTAGDYAGVVLTAGSRILRIRSLELASLTPAVFFGLIESGLLLGFDGTAATTQADTDFGRAEPGDLVHVSTIFSGAWDPATRPFPSGNQPGSYPMAGSVNDTRSEFMPPGVIEVPPGFSLQVQNQTSGQNLLMRFWAEELGP